MNVIQLKIEADTRKSQGFSLIEMMVSLVIGLFLLGGIFSIYLSGKGPEKMQREVTLMDANARIALSALKDGISHAGYPSIYNIPFDTPFISKKNRTRENTVCRGGNKVFSPYMKNRIGYTRDIGAGDQITIAYLADNPNDPRGKLSTDYLGGTMPEECSADPENGMYDPIKAVIYNRFYIDRNKGHLLAGGSRSGPDAKVLADNIETVHYLYGVTKNGITSYKRSIEVEKEDEWSSVTSVQIGLLVRSEKEVLETPFKGKIKVLNYDYSIRSAHQYRLHRLYSTTVNLPNRNRRVL